MEWLQRFIKIFPGGFLMVEKGNETIGQIELSIREQDLRSIGYVHLYYLTHGYRHKGLGKNVHEYSLRFFARYNVSEYQLRVSPTNVAALKFYREIGMQESGPEMNGKVLKMRGII
ncbi:GNAT family N-acetyltransferase [Rossellomorea vietnamensis]|uniref:GNAT family N-acetyltransferase n=2 Tax=Bacillales TaxID=1385 RepID=A0A5D4MEH8_9BACI|nr:GNAT family N-acetyltransferase [Rossellomorea vietnamensis]TYS00255.1 GNAT family N-acetyltransferase [Rossellomorea vietnamensis]